MSHTDILFKELHADELPEVSEIPSLCVNCRDEGVTRLLLTKIPFFRDVILASFNCDKCGYQNNSIDSAGKIQDKGIKLTLNVKTMNDLNRKMVQGKNSILKIKELESEFPVTEGVLTTVEGALQTVVDNIKLLQEERRVQNPELAKQLDEFIGKITEILKVERGFTLELRDISGNSVIENPKAPEEDPLLQIEYFQRSAEEDKMLGIEEGMCGDGGKTFVDEAQEEFKAKEEVAEMAINCPTCNVPTMTRMKMLDIPHFKEVIVMATYCEACGFKENEVKGGCGVSEKGMLYTLKIDETIDLSRDLLKSEVANIIIPELEIETSTGRALGGRFTTVEGIIRNIADQLLEMNPFCVGDSESDSSEGKLKKLVAKLLQVANGDMLGVTLIVRDPSGNSYVQDIYWPEQDPRLSLVYYERTFEENEDLGINDMVTDNY